MNIAVLTSGGDSPGMNAAIRSVVRCCTAQGHNVFGVVSGYEGLIQNNFIGLNLRAVANIIHRGGTLLKTSRSKDFLTKEGRHRAFLNLQDQGIGCLIALGGDGTIKGLETFQAEYPELKVFGIPCTIDNDFEFSEQTIGFDTAMNTAVSAIDKVRDTASSHQRTFVVEVMGRNSRILADEVGLAAGAEFVADLKDENVFSESLKVVGASIAKGKKASLIVALESELDEVSAASQIQMHLKNNLNIDCKTLVLGHIQRGGAPTAYDRNLASDMGYVVSQVVDSLQNGVAVSVGSKVLVKSFSELEILTKEKINRKKIVSLLSS